MWCDTFDADLLAVVPGATEALGPASETRLQTYSRLTDGKINCPSVWHTGDGITAFFWTDPAFRPGPGYSTSDPVADCTFLEAVRDEWVHSCGVSVNGHLVWKPPVRLMEWLMYDVRGWTALDGAEKERVQRDVLASLGRAAERLAVVLGQERQAAGKDHS